MVMHMMVQPLRVPTLGTKNGKLTYRYTLLYYIWLRYL